jgi:16S rRNA (cytidine1402-2'-O)-methyltransferase
MAREPQANPWSGRPDRSGPAARSKPARKAAPGAAAASGPTPGADAVLDPGLYLVATPIGNLADMGRRALAVLAGADVIACEDTRTTRKLLTAYGIDTRLTAYHEHNAARARPGLIERIKRGGAVALVSDAGTPLVSDPGYKLVRAAIDEGLAVTAIPGPSAALAALLVSGLPSDRFMFAGFLPAKAEARRRAVADLAAIPATLVLFESARRLPEALAALAEGLGPRPAAVARELTKLHEEVRRGSLSDLAAHYASAGPPKGEVAIVIGPPEDGAARATAEDLDTILRQALDAGLSVRDAVAEAVASTELPRQKVYARALELSGQRPARP